MLALLLVFQVGATDSLSQTHVARGLGGVGGGAQLDSQLTRFSDSGFSGAVLVVRDRHIVLLKGYGLADAGRGIRNTPATRFEMNSMTKMFTGAAVLQLAAAGRLKLNDPVEQYLGAFPEGKRGATVEQLASHTSGLIVAGSNLAGDSREAFVRDVKQTPRESAPGAEYRYTNAGFSLLAVIIEVASGEPYEDYLRQHLFEPAGMRTAVFRDDVPDRDTLFARGRVGTANPYVWGTRGAGGVWATVGDMYRWVVAIEDSVVLREAERRILFSPHKPPAQEAYGWHVSPTRIDKGGGSANFASQLLYYPDQRTVIVWACNDLRQRWRAKLNQVLGEIVRHD